MQVAPVFTHLQIKNFASIRSADIPLAPLTMLVGKNGSGKSSVLRALSSVAALGGEEYRRIQEVFRRTEYPDAGAAIADSGTPITIRGQVEDAPYLNESDVYRLGRGTCELTASISGVIEYEGLRPDLEPKLETLEGYTVVEYKPYVASKRIRWRSSFGLQESDWAWLREFEVSEFWRFLSGVRSVSLEERLGHWYDKKEADQRHDGAASILALLSRADESVALGENSGSETRLRDFSSHLQRVFGEGWKLSMRGDSVFVHDPAGGPEGVRVPIALTSLGTRQLVPLLARGVSLQADEALLAEEPELSLHPEAQVAVGEILGELATERRQYIVTTHGHYLLMGALKRVREGALPHDDVAILDCEKGPRGTIVTRIPVDSSGRVEGWIPSFTDVDNYLFRGWADDLRRPGNGDQGSI